MLRILQKRKKKEKKKKRVSRPHHLNDVYWTIWLLKLFIEWFNKCKYLQKNFDFKKDIP